MNLSPKVFASKLVASCLFATTLFSFSASASINVLDFDSFNDGQIIDNEYISNFGVSISSVNYKGRHRDIIGRQVAFNTLNDRSRDNDLEFNNRHNDYQFSYTALNLPGYLGRNNPGNILILQENGKGCGDGICDKPDDEGSRAAGYFEFRFSSLVNILNLDFFDVEEQRGQLAKYSAIQFFDGVDNEIHKNHFIPSMGDGEFVRQSFTGITGVKRLVLNLPGSGGIDNLAFEAHSGAAEVPAPASLALLSFGVLFAFRRKISRAWQANNESTQL
jgi:hypothetical protein